MTGRGRERAARGAGRMADRSAGDEAGTGPDVRVHVGTSELVYVGPALGIRSHSTAVPRLLLALDEPFVLVGPTASATPLRALYVPARTRHAVATPGIRWLVVYLEPGSHRDRACRHRGIPDPDRLVHLARTGRVRHLLDAIGPAGRPSSPTDEVITRMLREPATRVSAAAMAASVGLSLAHFLRTFTEDTGTTFRLFGRWVRLLEATRLVSGRTLTETATDAGFASPSHFSDTVRWAFGFTATELLATGVRIEPI